MEYIESDHIRWNANRDKVVVLDQTKLPNREVFLELGELQEMYDAIYFLQVRGAPCIGIFAGYAIAVRARAIWMDKMNYEQFYCALKREAAYLNESRPTAVNLSWAIKRMLTFVETHKTETREVLLNEITEEAIRIHEEDIAMCHSISEYGLTLVKDGDGILTHCNAGPLATSRYGTALGPILLGEERGYHFHVFSDETRPLLQGTRLTSYELGKKNVDVTLICDNMASIIMKQGKIQACFVGCDRVAANGDTANKIGTSGVAILAKYYGIPFYVLGPYSSIDLNCPNGDKIVIEERKPNEIKEMFYKEPFELPHVKCYNPAFDVTDHSLITAIVTDRGICYPPFSESILRFADKETK